MVVVKTDADLLEIVAALGPRCRLANPLDRRHQKCYENSDDGDDNQELDERESIAATHPALLIIQSITKV